MLPPFVNDSNHLLTSLCFCSSLSFQVGWSWASTQVDRDSDTGSIVSKTKARKWNIGTHLRSKEPRAATSRTRSSKGMTSSTFVSPNDG